MDLKKIVIKEDESKMHGVIQNTHSTHFLTNIHIYLLYAQEYTNQNDCVQNL